MTLLFQGFSMLCRTRCSFLSGTIYIYSVQLHQNSINQEAKKIASELELDDRIETLAERESFITLKALEEQSHTPTEPRDVTYVILRNST